MEDENKQNLYKLFGHSTPETKSNPNLIISDYYNSLGEMLAEYKGDTTTNNKRRTFLEKYINENQVIINMRGDGSCFINALYIFLVLNKILPLTSIENINSKIKELNEIVINGIEEYRDENIVIEDDIKNVIEDVRTGNNPETAYVSCGIMKKYKINIIEYGIRGEYNIESKYTNNNQTNDTLYYINDGGHVKLIYPRDLLNRQLTSFLIDNFTSQVPDYDNDKSLEQNIVSSNNLVYCIYLICVAIIFGLVGYFSSNQEQYGGLEFGDIFSVINLQVIYKIVNTFENSPNHSPGNLFQIIKETLEQIQQIQQIRPIRHPHLELFDKKNIPPNLTEIANTLLTNYDIIISKTKPYGVKLDIYSEQKIKNIANDIFLALKDLDKLYNNMN